MTFESRARTYESADRFGGAAHVDGAPRARTRKSAPAEVFMLPETPEPARGFAAGEGGQEQRQWGQS
jgi:hypothetical protein